MECGFLVFVCWVLYYHHQSHSTKHQSKSSPDQYHLLIVTIIVLMLNCCCKERLAALNYHLPLSLAGIHSSLVSWSWPFPS